jgi:hypothetical protein
MLKKDFICSNPPLYGDTICTEGEIPVKNFEYYQEHLPELSFHSITRFDDKHYTVVFTKKAIALLKNVESIL